MPTRHNSEYDPAALIQLARGKFVAYIQALPNYSLRRLLKDSLRGRYKNDEYQLYILRELRRRGAAPQLPPRKFRARAVKAYAARLTHER